MAGSREGAIKARETMFKRYGKDYFKKIGSVGGANGKTGGFASEKKGPDGLTGTERAQKYGVINGTLYKRGPTKKKRGQENEYAL